MSIIIPNQATPVTPPAGYTELFIDSNKRLSTVDETPTTRVFVDRASAETLSSKIISLAPGTALVPPLSYDATSVLLTTPVAGAAEFDAAAFYETIDTTSGRAQTPNMQIFRLTADGSAIGAAIADYFGANSAFPFVLNGVYLLEFHLYFLKTTAGTVTWTLTNTQTYTNLNAFWIGNVITGFGATGATSGAGISKQTTAASALPVTGSLSTATDHYYIIRAIAEMGTAGNVRLRATESAGTITPRRGSYYTATRLSAANVGTFVA